MPRTRAERAAAYLKSIAGEEGVEAFRVDAAEAEALSEGRRQQERAMGLESLSPAVSSTAINAALETVMAGTELPRDQRAVIEAIVIPDKRPAMPLARGTYTATHRLWRHLNEEAIRSRLTRLARSIGRIEVPGSKYPFGGTGFIVGPGLIMTNRHVAEIFVNGVGDRRLEFISGIDPGFSTAFAPDNAETPALEVTGVVMVHPFWDMALLKVEGLPADLEPLTLAGGDVAAFADKQVAVIGYPAFDPRNDVAVQRMVFDNRFGIKQLLPGYLRGRVDAESYSKIVSAVFHDASTLGGASGSATLDIATGKVVGLHFGGEYLVGNYAVPASELAADGRIVDAGVAFDTGASAPGVPPWDGFWTNAETVQSRRRRTDSATSSARPVSSASGGATPAGVQVSSANAAIDVVVPLHITIRLGEPGAATTIAAAAEASGAALTERMVEPVRDTNYARRRGFDANFLGSVVPFPEPADPSVVATTRAGGSLLHYQHFSVAMHAARRLALITGANVTAEPRLKEPEPGDYTRDGLGGLGEDDQEKWFTDERLDPAYQIPDVFYTRDDGAFDKGHIVRREDVAWGRSYAEVRRANGDTFHVTNCSPQVKVFNRSTLGRENWGDLEDVVLDNAASERLCVFGGPVLAADDPRFLGNFGRGQRSIVQIPVKFWKVIVARAVDGIAAFGFVLEQDLAEVPITEFAMPDAFAPYLEPIADIASLAGVTFAAAILDADQFDLRGPEVARRAGVGRRRRR